MICCTCGYDTPEMLLMTTHLAIVHLWPQDDITSWVAEYTTDMLRES